MKRFRIVLLLILPVVAALALALHYAPLFPRGTPALSHSAYVWQRAWTTGVVDAVIHRPERLSKLIVLAAQVDWDRTAPRVRRVSLNYAALRATGRPPGLALRIASRTEPLRPGDPVVEQLATLARDLVQRAREAGLSPTELQIDFDSAESRLEEYQAWLTVLRRAVPPLPLTITLLPCWLRHPECASLLRATDGFVLQVHSLTRPDFGTPADKLALVDLDAARDAVHRAAAIGVPFEVALPTYGYLAAFDREGTYLGLNTEGPLPRWPRDAILRELRTDPAAMASLVQEWQAHRPRSMRGVIWYRLPVAGDRHNWSRDTLVSVMEGRVPKAMLSIRTRATQGGRLVDIALVNTGTADAELDPIRVAVHLAPDQLEARDGLSGFTATPLADGLAFVLRFGQPAVRLPPGEECAVGWVRLTAAGRMRVEVERR
jgi:hypothetical protein